jgi:DNA-binding Lrp family transcriptional regulator
MSAREFQFHDRSFPARIWMLVKDRTLDGIDLLLMMVIADLTKPHESAENPGEGCWASNETIGKAVGLHPINVSRRLKALKKDKLLLVFEVNSTRRAGPTRYMELEWSRTGEERLALTGDYGRVYRKSYQKTMEVRLQEPTKPLAEALTPLSGSAKTPLSGSANQYYKETVDKEKSGSRVAAPLFGSSPPEPRNRVGNFVTPVKEDYDRASRLRQASRAKGIRLGGSSKKAEAAHFHRLTKDVGQSRVDRALSYYCKHIGEPELPRVNCAKQFCNGCFNWIENINKSETTKKKQEEMVW